MAEPMCDVVVGGINTMRSKSNQSQWNKTDYVNKGNKNLMKSTHKFLGIRRNEENVGNKVQNSLFKL